MDSDVSRNKASESEDADLSFAFNDSSFSDRIIHLEIMNNLMKVCSNVESSSTCTDRSSFNKRREDMQKHNADLLLDKPDVEADAMVEVSTDGEKAANLHMDCSAVVKVKTLHVSSSILAAKSSIFYKLFFNGMSESKQTHITVRINASEEAPFMELLKFMYNNSLNVTSPPSLLDVLMAADKFGVASCIRYCIRGLLNTPMTPESAVLYLELPYSVLMNNVVRPLFVAAKQYLVARYKNITKHREELMELPLAGVLTLLSSDELQVAYEDVVYDFMLKWAQTQYPRLEERRNILREKLIPFIRFPYMTCRKLKMIQTCNDFGHEFASKLIFDALHFKAETPHRQRILAAESASTSRRFIERSYKFRPIKVVEFELPRKQCVVYLDLKQEECTNLFPSGRVCSQAFHLGDRGFFLSANCSMGQQSICHCFGLFLGMQGEGSVNFRVDYEFAVRSRPTLEYITKHKGNFIFTGVQAVSYKNIFCTPWTSFLAKDNLFFINGILHLRVEVTIRS